MVDLYQLLDIDKDLVSQFSIFFSRFEYALKRTVHYAKGNENRIEADWDKFAAEHDSMFNPGRDPTLKAAVVYLESNPPQKQVLKRGTFGWKDVPKQEESKLRNLLLCVRRVRNNLFHGGKFPLPDGSIEEPGRNTQLLQSCLRLLEECLLLNTKVDGIFKSRER